MASTPSTTDSRNTSPYPPPTRGRIVVWGLLAGYPFGGMTWQALHYVVGLRRLGFDVWYVEDSSRALLDPVNYWPSMSEYEANAKFLAEQMASVGLADRWIFRPPERQDFCVGARDYAGLKQLYREADAVINLCGAQEPRADHDVIRCLVYMETDPVPTQVAVAKGEQATIDVLTRHHILFTYGENLGRPSCRVPVERFTWHPTRPPVILDWWQSDRPTPADGAFTTIANWKHSAKDVEWQGEQWRWSKHYEFLKFLDIARDSPLPLEIAVGNITPAELQMIQDKGWRTRPSGSVSVPNEYRRYIQDSLGEFTATKEQYVRPRTGWFSDRSVCYLAAGRPVITQETGFSENMPSGEGLIGFSTPEEALQAIARVAADYPRHCRAARAIAAECFCAEKILEDVVRKIGLA